jgi:methylmalonyl-CoA epimerase
MMARRLSHVGIVVRNIEEAVELFTKTLGFSAPPTGIVDVPEAGVKSALIPIGNNYIEFLQPTDPNTATGALQFQILEERGEGLLHLCIEVDDVDAEVKSLQGKGVQAFEIPQGEVVDYKSAYLLPESAKGVPIELVPKGTAHKSVRRALGLKVIDAPLPQ